MALPHMNNEELVSNIINFSSYGALSQVMVMQAIEHFTNLVIEQEEDLLREEQENICNGNVSLVSLKSWVEVAKEIKQKLDDNR